MANKLYIGNLSYQVSEKDLEELFSKAGTVESVRIITDTYSGQSRGFGFVEMSNSEEAKEAISKFNGYSFKDREIVVSEARPKREGTRRGRGPREGGGRRAY